MIKNPFKLQKLEIKAYKKNTRRLDDYIDTFEVMFNPQTIKRSFSAIMDTDQAANSSSTEVKYMGTPPEELVLELLLDGTGVTSFGFEKASFVTVEERLSTFFELAHDMNGEIHEPNYLKVEWGSLSFPCRLSSADIDYSLFDRDGTPLRATLTATFIADQSHQDRLAEEEKQSPDLTHLITVKAGDSLFSLCRDIYGDSRYYPEIARVNALDNFRNLEVGTQLRFPPMK